MGLSAPRATHSAANCEMELKTKQIQGEIRNEMSQKKLRPQTTKFFPMQCVYEAQTNTLYPLFT